MYYLKLAAKLLQKESPEIEKVAGEEGYYYALCTGEREAFESIYDEKDDPMNVLAAIECSAESPKKRKVLETISIFDYVEEEDFAVLLNRYVLCKLENKCLSEDEKQQICEWIDNRKCEFGYSTYGGGYDFRTSAYYANILYVLDGGEDVGLR